MVLGSFYMTISAEDMRRIRAEVFADEEDALLAYRSNQLDLHERSAPACQSLS